MDAKTGRRLVAAAAIVLSLGAFPPGPVRAQELTIGGQVRPRLETLDPAPADGRGRTFTSMRTRLSVEAAPRPGLSVFVQLQDVRLFGEEGSTLGDFTADALDVHQAWVGLGGVADPFGLRVGRQEVSLGGQRLVGAVDWTQQGRSFDGARVRIGPAGPGARADVFAFQLSESASPARSADAAFIGAMGTLTVGPSGTLELYGLLHRVEAGDADTGELTAGGRFVASAGPVDYRVEGAWQTGERGGTDVDAWFLGARAGTAFAGGDATVTLWYDHLSGGAPGDGEVGAFSTLFATNHKFYGFADLFLDIPLHTAGRGLRDAAVKATWRPAPRWTAGLDLHRFAVAEDRGLASGHLGDEVDLTVGRALADGARLTGGLSYVAGGDALATVRGMDGSVVSGYLMLDVVF